MKPISGPLVVFCFRFSSVAAPRSPFNLPPTPPLTLRRANVTRPDCNRRTTRQTRRPPQLGHLRTRTLPALTSCERTDWTPVRPPQAQPLPPSLLLLLLLLLPPPPPPPLLLLPPPPPPPLLLLPLPPLPPPLPLLLHTGPSAQALAPH
ncbi:uncharacterized protein ACOB8E_021592 [Sarcophilus harrisii]